MCFAIDKKEMIYHDLNQGQLRLRSSLFNLH